MISEKKKGTYNKIFDIIDRKQRNKLVKFKTLYKAKCLKCGVPIFVSYSQIAPYNLYCNIHKGEGRKTILTDAEELIQAHYMKHIKEEQLKIIEKSLK